MNAREAASITAVIAAAFPQWPATRETVAVYADLLSDLPYPETMRAVKDLLLTEERWPTVAGIRRAVGERSGALAPSSGQAWGEVSKAAADTGRASIPRWSHPALSEAISSIGWFNLCTSANPETMRAQFTRLYEDAKRRHDRDALIEPGRLSLDRPGRDDGRAEIVATTPE